MERIALELEGNWLEDLFDEFFTAVVAYMTKWDAFEDYLRGEEDRARRSTTHSRQD